MYTACCHVYQLNNRFVICNDHKNLIITCIKKWTDRIYIDIWKSIEIRIRKKRPRNIKYWGYLLITKNLTHFRFRPIRTEVLIRPEQVVFFKYLYVAMYCAAFTCGANLHSLDIPNGTSSWHTFCVYIYYLCLYVCLYNCPYASFW